METTTSFTPSRSSTSFTSSITSTSSTSSTLFTFSTPRVARIQFYDYLYTRNLKNDYRIGLSENLWKELIRESDNDNESQTIIKSSICDNVCYVSQDFAKRNNLYNGAIVEVNNANPVELDEVILGTLTYESYELSLRDPITISKYFQNSSSTPIIIRQGQTYSLQNLSSTTTEDDISSFEFKVLMCNPVLQGIITDQTDFIITDISEDALYDIYYDDQYNLESNNLDDQNELLDQNILDLKDDDGLNFLLANLDVGEQDQLIEEEEFERNLSHSFFPIALTYPFPTNILQPTPNEKEDSESRVLVSLKELAKLGLQSGSWVLISGSKIEKTRMCRIYAVDVPSLIELISRIASPHSTDRNIYNASINGLKKWFEDAKRIVCEGDIIPIPIDARLKPQRSEGDIEEIENIHISTKPIKFNIIVYFKVSKINLKKKKKCMIYGYGRQVDSKNTRLMQTGLEHSKVPVLKLYFNIVTETPSFSHINPILTAPETPFTKLFELISSCLHPNATSLNLSCTVLLHGSRGCGKKTIVEWVAERVGVHVYEVNCFEFSGESDSKTESSLRAKIDKAVTFSPCIFLLRHIDALARKSVALETGQEPSISSVLQDSFKQLLENFQTIGYPVLVVGTTGDIEKIPASVISCFRHEISFEAPDEPCRLAILEHLTREIPIAPDVSLSSLATQTAALVAKDLVDLVARAGFVAHERVKKSLIETNKSLKDSDLVYAGIALTADDFNEALTKARSSYSDSIGAPKIPNVTWDDVGGLASIKDDILDTIQLPLEHPELFATGMKKRSGILLYGPPGTGKTLLAKAVATSCSLNFFSVKGPELLNMYIGESEANVRRVFQRARDAKPCVIFFDELDSVAPKRGEKGDSGGVMDRIVSQLLAELDGMGQGGGTTDVFVIGATNRPDLLDPALLRPGRFDKLLYLGVSEDHDTQLNIIQALTRKFRLHPSLNLRSVAEKCPFNYTGADFYALCSDAVLKAMSRTAEKVEAKVAQLNSNPKPNLPQPITSQYYLNHLASPEDTLVEVIQEDFEKALRELVPSVSEKELEYYRTVQMRFTQQVESKQQQMNKEEPNIVINQSPQLNPPLEYNEQINIGVGVGGSSSSYSYNNNINNNGTIEFEESPYVVDSIKKGKGKDRAE
ncbi:3910_t:CDS:10 [Diversispora eburnea]|uniref:Peroxisomal ATPase PEX6 n=1 Tax=Diversispora eburnea TaxID=1213867 RepID=A0A9N8ZSJ4_9GLOM|nr:3910_t:CDS:10 [Diversispora eburnea]